MKATNINIIDSYLGLLDHLSPDSKLELISRLSQSLKSQKKSEEKSVQELFGAFESEKSAEAIIEEIRQARTFTRQIEEL
jgi:tRNA A-37 threonylcarbamoyl transferase component Bud32